MKYLLFILCMLLSSCSNVSQVNWQRIDGAKCQTVHVRPVYWSAETATTCLINNKVETVQTSHDDATYLIAGVLGVLITAGLAGL